MVLLINPPTKGIKHIRMDLEKHYKVSGHLEQIRDIGKLIMEIHQFRAKFSKPTDLGFFHHLPTDLHIELKNVCDKMENEFDKLIKIERDKI